MDHLNKCVFCSWGVTDDKGSRCGAKKVLEDPKTLMLVQRAIKEECGNAQERFERRMHIEPLRPEMTVSA